MRYFSGKYLHEITAIEIERFKNDEIKINSPATVNRKLARLKALFNKAIQWKKFEGENPVRGIKFLKEDNHKLRFLEVEEIKRLIDSCDGILKPLVITAVNTGMRRGELFNLKWHDIDFNQSLIHLLETKSGKERVIPMNEVVKNTLVATRKSPESPYIFCRDGHSIKDIRRSFRSALKKAKIENFRFHDLRHTFASQLVMSGVNLNTVRELLGHSDLKTTLIYAHLSKGHKMWAVNTLCQKISPSINQKQENSIPAEVLITVAH